MLFVVVPGQSHQNTTFWLNENDEIIRIEVDYASTRLMENPHEPTPSVAAARVTSTLASTETTIIEISNINEPVDDIEVPE